MDTPRISNVNAGLNMEALGTLEKKLYQVASKRGMK
jgi:hypothetical protein